MRRAATFAVLVALGGTACALGFVSWRISASTIADHLGATAGASPQLRLGPAGAATFRALPWPSVDVVDVRLNGVGGAIEVSAPEARLDLSLVDLVRGRLTPVRASFASPIVTLDLDRSAWMDAAQAARAFAPLDAVSLADGVLRVRSRERGFDVVVENLKGRFAGFAAGEPLRIDLSATWRDAPFAVTGFLADPERVARGKPAAMNFVVASPAAAMSFKGALAQGAVPGLAGSLSLSVPSLSALARLFGVHAPPIFPGDDVAVAARIAASPNEAALAEATVTSAGQTLQGALQVTVPGGRPALSGTLDADQLALKPLVGLAEPLIDEEGRWSRRPFGIAPPKDFDVDLRLSAGRLNAYGHELANAAVSLILKDGVLTATLIDAAAYGGRLKGEAKFGCARGDLDIEARGALSDADFGAAFSDFGWSGMGGRGTGEFALESMGDSPAALVAGLRGSASVRLEQGALAGINLEEVLRRSQRRRIDAARDKKTGGTTFDRLKLKLALSRGVVDVVSGALAAQGVAGAVQGRIDLVEKSLGLRFSAMQTDSSGEESQDAAHVTLDVHGPWSEPRIGVAGDKAEDPGAGSGATLSP